MERKIVSYYVTQATNKDDLATQVKNNIAKGWCPFGGVSFMAYTYTTRSGPVLDEKWQQALVYYEASASASASAPSAASQVAAAEPSQVGSARRRATRRRR